MGNLSEYKTFSGQIGKGLGISAPSTHNYAVQQCGSQRRLGDGTL